MKQLIQHWNLHKVLKKLKVLCTLTEKVNNLIKENEIVKNKPYDKKNSINSLGSDLTTCIQNFHYAGEEIEKADDEKINKGKRKI